MTRRRWLPRPAPFPDAAVEDSGSGFPPPIEEVLTRRGFHGDRLREFLSPDRSHLTDIDSLPGATGAAAVIAEAVNGGSKIVIHGDFDADGITATALLKTGLERLGADVSFHIPDRFEDGYGLTANGVEACAAMGAGLVVTVDCGMTASREIAELRDLGIPTVVTDHHQPSGQLPDAKALTSPVLAADGSPHSDLSGAGVAWIVLAGVTRCLGGDPGRMEDLLQLAALGTVCDVVNLTGSNRTLVREGLRLLRGDPLPGLSALAGSASVDLSGAASSDLAFYLGPRLNACGRVGHASEAVDLLLAGDMASAKELVVPVERNDRERRKLDAAVRKSAMAIASRIDSPRCLVLDGPGWHRGVIGITASRLADMYGVPSIMLSVEDGMARGSARSVPGISIHSLLERIQDESGILDRFGGHPMAAGLSLESSRVCELRSRLDALLGGPEWDRMLGPVLYIDGRLEGRWMTLETVRSLEMLEPFGEGNREPVWIARGARAMDWRAVGKGKDHLSCVLRVGDRDMRAIGFGLAGRQSLFGGPVDIAFTLAEDRWRGDGSVQLQLKDVRRQRPLEST